LQPETASQVCRRNGLKGLNQVSEITGQSPQTLINWYNNKRSLFDIVILGCLTQVDLQRQSPSVQPAQPNES
jgi:hypothetical protein